MDDIGGGDYKEINQDGIQTFGGKNMEYRVIDENEIKSCSKREFEAINNEGRDEVMHGKIRCRYIRTITVIFKRFTITCDVHQC